MGLFNVLEVNVTCPRCHREVYVQAEFRFGVVNVETYRLGDMLPWVGERPSIPKVRPEGGNYKGEGYAVCPLCDVDFYVDIEVKNNILVSAVPDPSRPGYVPLPE